MSVVDVLVVEDSDQKYSEIAKAIHDATRQVRLVRVGTVTEGEDRLQEPFDLVVLDVSISISPMATGVVRGGHADLGGYNLVEFMYLNEIDAPVVVVTGLDYFRLQAKQGISEMIGLEDLERLIRAKIGDQLIGFVRFGSAGWARDLISIIEKADAA